MDGANTDGGSDGTGDFLVGSEIFAPHSNTVTGVGPINMVFPPSTLKNPTTLYPGPFITSLEIAHPMTTTITAHGTVTVTTTMTRVIETTTIPLAPITLGAIPWWNWNITSHNKTNGSTVLFPSIEIGPVAISDNFSAFNISMASPTTTSNRTIIVPPWPWSTTSLSTTVPHGKTVHFTEGSPPGPKCTAGCGHKCRIFCHRPCMFDCDVGGGKKSGFDDPSDSDPPHKHKCGGPDCKDGECDGPLCASFGCEGDDCDKNSGTCLGKQCHKTGCIGAGCKKGSCHSKSCHHVGCSGNDCDPNGGCFGLDCISIGCIGASCNTADGTCSTSDCQVVSCSGPNCRNGLCSGEGCVNGDSECQEEKVNICTEFVYSQPDTARSTSTTKTSTSCDTITACSATATTTTTTLTENSSYDEPFYAWEAYTNTAVIDAVASEIDAAFRSAESSWERPTTTSTTSKTATSKTSTSTGPAATSKSNTTPDEVSYTCSGMSRECPIFLHMRAFCNQAKSVIRGSVVYG